MDLSEYEQQRLRNMAENARVLSELGVADAASSLRPEKRPRAPASSTPREFQPRTKMRTSYRSAGVAADDEAAKSAALQLAAKDQPFRGPNPNSPYVPRPQGPPPLSDEQRANLAAAKEGWLGKMEAWLRSSGASEFNTKKVMERVYELVSGQGVPLRGLYSGAAFEGRAVKLTDDLVELRATGKRLYGKYDIGGWSINHPIGKMIKFQAHLFSESSAQWTAISASTAAAASAAAAPSAAASSAATGTDGGVGGRPPSATSGSAAAAAEDGWLRVGAPCEVRLEEEGIHGARYTATILAFGGEGVVDGHGEGRGAGDVRVLYDELLPAGAVDESSLAAAAPPSSAEAEASAGGGAASAREAREAARQAIRAREEAKAAAVAAEEEAVGAGEGVRNAKGQTRLAEWVKASQLSPPPPRITGFEAKLSRGHVCELWFDDGWWEVEVLEKAKPTLRKPTATFEVASLDYADIGATVDAARLRPKLRLVDGSDWLALAPFGFKCPLGTTELAVAPPSSPTKTAVRQAGTPAAEAVAAAAEEPAWLDSGHRWLGQRVRRFFGGSVSDGVLTKWVDAGKGEDEPALWHMAHDDGDEEDLEAWEVRAAIGAKKRGLTRAP